MPTTRNVRGVDIIAYNQDAIHKIAVQVKTLSKRSPVPLGSQPPPFPQGGGSRCITTVIGGVAGAILEQTP
jgi:hypothetical protein